MIHLSSSSRRLIYCSPFLFAAFACRSSTAAAAFLRPHPHQLQILKSFGSNLPISRMTSTTTTISNTNSADDNNDNKPSNKKPIVQYIVVRRDLAQEPYNWPPGAIAAQVAHVSVAAIAQGLETQDVDTAFYISESNLPHMTKYVYGVNSLTELEQIRNIWQDKIDSNNYYWWIEQPENIPTAFATWPIERTNKVSKIIKQMKLSFY